MREGPLGLLADCPYAPKYSIPSAPRASGLAVAGASPGPGQYDVGRALEAVRPSKCVGSFPRAMKAEKAVELSELGSNVTKLPSRVKGGVLCEAVATREPVASTPGPEFCPPSSLRPQGAVYMGDFPSRRRPRPASAPAAGRRSAPVEPKATTPVPGVSFATARRTVAVRQGPDTLYMPPSTLRTRAASCLNGHRPESSLLELRPDPQTYRQALPLRPECQSFSGARRWSSEPVVGLGPGSYQSALAQHVKGVVKMSTAQRFGSKEVAEAPGPGAYESQEGRTGGGNRTTFARAPREERCKEYSNLAGERRARVMRSFFRAGTLPPGTFRTRAARLAPRSMPRKAKATGAKEPGPGSFEASKLSTKNACIFKTSPRWSKAPSQDPGPGPGSYRVELESRPKLGRLAPRGCKAEEPESPPGPGPDYKVYTLFPED